MKIKISCEQEFLYEISAICKANYAERTYYIATFRKAGKIGVLNERLVPLCIFEPQGIAEIQSVSVHPYAHSFVVAGSNVIHVYDLNGNLIEPVEGNIVEIHHSLDGRYLWCIRKGNAEQFTIEVRDTENLNQILAERVCEDILYDSTFSIGLTPQINEIYLSRGAGQDGSVIGFAKFMDKDIDLIYPDSLNKNNEAVVPIWGENEHEFLLQQGDIGIFKYEYTSCQLLQEYLFPEDMEYVGYHHAYLKKDKAIIQYDEQFWVLDLNVMLIEAPFCIDRHEPKETKCFYPSLADDTSMMTDIYYLKRFDNTLIGFTGIKENHSIFLIELANCLEG